MKLARIEYGRDTKPARELPRSVGLYKYYAHLQDIKNDVTIVGKDVSTCITKAVDMIQHPERFNIKVLRVDKAK